MSATITDYFNKASNMSGSYPAVATVTAARSTGGSTLSCDDLSSWATDTPVHFSTFKVNTDGTIDTATQTDWKGIVNGNTITDMTRLAGAADSGNASGDRVELNPTVGWLDDLITGILVSHKQNGALKDNAVTESSIATGAVTSSKVAAGAISSYDKIGDDVIQARNLDDGAVTADKIDFATATVLFSNAENIGSASRTVASYTIEKAGKYFIFMNADLNCIGLDVGDANLAILKNSSNVQGVYFNNPQRAYFIGGIQLFTVQECNPGDIISVRGSCSQNKFSISTGANRSNLQIIRIS